MKTNPVTRSNGNAHLSVIHKTVSSYDDWSSWNEAVVQTDLNLNVTGWNPAAEQLHGRSGAMGRNLFELVQLDFINTTADDVRNHLSSYRCWTGEVIFYRFDGQRVHLQATANYIINEKEEPVSILIVSNQISELQLKERELAIAEKKYQTVVNTLFDGVLMIDSRGRVTACNKRASELLRISEEQFVGNGLRDLSKSFIQANGLPFIFEKLPVTVTLRTGFAQRNIIIGVKHPDESVTWLQVNSQGIFNGGEEKPVAVVVSFSDITEKLKSEVALKTTSERLHYAGRVASDAIWDLNLETNEIYRSEAFSVFSGYSLKDVTPSLDWWFNKIHADDRQRVKKKLDDCISSGASNWKDEYRFQCADGGYRFLQDSGIILYKDKKPVRFIGAIHDLTERKQLEERLLQEEIQKQKQLRQAAIAAQESERNNISRELHDNVNQIIMSSKLFIETALKAQSTPDPMLQKALEYQVLAIEEIRKLSRSLNSSLVHSIGLNECVADIIANMKQLQQVNVDSFIDDAVLGLLDEEKKLMVFRIIQEQTNNIIKYARAENITIRLTMIKSLVRLEVSDDGIGFDMRKKSKGIGLSNIFTRADAYNGRVKIKTSPGKGCSLEVIFPVK